MANLHKLKQEVCEIGSRIYKKGFAAANDGNISYKLSDNEVLCTPTQVCKGFLKPEDLCIVDMEGNQISGTKKRTSEIFLHLAMFKAKPDMQAIVHCHPPHATAFGIAREPVPQCVLPEVEIYMGDVPIARYEIPGGQEFADTILPYVHKSPVIILANHGTVSYGETIEKAYWWTELLDAYCRMLLLARQLGRVGTFTEQQTKDLLDLKQKFNIPDPRIGAENCELCANDMFRDSWKETGVSHQAFQPPYFHRDPSAPSTCSAPQQPSSDPQTEQLVQMITERVLAALKANG
jgi:L-fuculose-phosphate aldolase